MPSSLEIEVQRRNDFASSASNATLTDEYIFDTIVKETQMEMPRSLNQRHVRMIGVAGTIGVGLFLDSGQALSKGGPAGALIAYVLVATVAFSTMRSVGEMTVFAPVAGSFPYFAERWVDPALGFSVGWAYWLFNALSVSCEISSAVVVINYWKGSLAAQSRFGATMGFMLAIFILNIIAVRYFGEVETFFSFLKTLFIFGLLLGGIIINASQNLGFKYWREPGPWAGAVVSDNPHADRFLGFIAAAMQAAFSFQGMEVMMIVAAETRNPRTNISLAVNRVVIRISIFYVLGILIAGILVPRNDDELLTDLGTGAQSPFVIAFSLAGIKALPSLLNGVILLSALFAANSFLFAGCRVLYGVSLRQQAPQFISKLMGYSTGRPGKGEKEWFETPLNRGIDLVQGVPGRALMLTWLFSFLAFIQAKDGSPDSLFVLVSLASSSCFVTWFAMNLTYIRFYNGLQMQKRRPKDNHFHSPLQPYLAYWGLLWSFIFIVFNGYRAMGNRSDQRSRGKDFAEAYTSPIFVLFLYLGYKYKNWMPYAGTRFELQGTNIVKYWDMDFTTIEIEDNSVPERWWQKIYAWIF